MGQPNKPLQPTADGGRGADGIEGGRGSSTWDGGNLMSRRLNRVRGWGTLQPPAAAERAARINRPPARYSAADSVGRQKEVGHGRGA